MLVIIIKLYAELKQETTDRNTLRGMSENYDDKETGNNKWKRKEHVKIIGGR